jgi:hypothetical protein
MNVQTGIDNMTDEWEDMGSDMQEIKIIGADSVGGHHSGNGNWLATNMVCQALKEEFKDQGW